MSFLAMPLSRVWAYSCVLALIAALLVFSGQYDPDFKGYRVIYEYGGAWLSATGRDPAFVLLIDVLNERFSYEEFRIFLAVVFGIGLWVFVSRSDLPTRTIIFLAPLVMLKFHAQIREGLALLIWLLALTTYKKTWIVGHGVLSSAIHIGALPLWVARFITHRWLVAAIFAGYGVFATPLGRALFAFDAEGFIRDTGFGVDVTGWKVLYWSFFLILPMLVLVFTRPLVWADATGRIGTFGLLGFFPVAVSSSFITGAGEGEFANVLRVANTLITLLGARLSLVAPRSVLTWVIGAFAFADVVRLLTL